jgi:hypothetical protein
VITSILSAAPAGILLATARGQQLLLDRQLAQLERIKHRAPSVEAYARLESTIRDRATRAWLLFPALYFARTVILSLAVFGFAYALMTPLSVTAPAPGIVLGLISHANVTFVVEEMFLRVLDFAIGRAGSWNTRRSIPIRGPSRSSTRVQR